MADPQSEVPALSEFVRVGTDRCPCVADLIEFALGQALAHDRHRVEAHLKDDDCSHCRRWIENAIRHTQQMRQVVVGKGLDAATFLASPPPATSLPADRTPIPPSSRWQRHVFTDLVQRLSQLDEG
jgi:predicted anti-sigma-YlaC factor YlaD